MCGAEFIRRRAPACESGGSHVPSYRSAWFYRRCIGQDAGCLPAFWKVIPRGGSASAFNYTPDASAKTDTIVHYAATIWPRARARLRRSAAPR